MLAYKIGQLRMLALRQKAQAALKERFDLRAFHEALLAQGALPLDLLEQQVDGWIAAGKLPLPAPVPAPAAAPEAVLFGAPPPPEH